MYCITLMNFKQNIERQIYMQCSFIDFMDRSYNADVFFMINAYFFCNFNVIIDSFFQNCCWYSVL